MIRQRVRVVTTLSLGPLPFAATVACSTAPEPSAQASAPSSPSASLQTPNSSRTTTHINTREDFGDTQFLLTVSDAGVVGSDAVLVQVAKDICAGIETNGIATSTELFALLRENQVAGIDMIDAVSVASAGILHHCSEHSEIIDS